MMRSLWSGVSGLQAHQIAMDVESDNIANVNTIGHKYSRVSFSTIFSQTSRIATGPTDDLGGRNATQVGLGTHANATTTIYKQGSIQTTDKSTDLALDGDGFFVLSRDGGKSYLYTRNGDFIRDSRGNLVDNSGFVVQGWMRNETTGKIDPTTPMSQITIEPGLSIPAKNTTEVAFKGNLNSGDDVGTLSSPIYSLDSHHGWYDRDLNHTKEEGEQFGSSITSSENDTSHAEYYVDEEDGQIKMQEKGVDMGVLFNSAGDSLNISEKQGIWVSYADAKVTYGDGRNPIAADGSTLHLNLNGIEISGAVNNTGDVVNLLNNYTNLTGIVASVVNGEQLQLVNQNSQGTTAQAKNIKLYDMGSTGINGIEDTAVITAYQYTYTKTSTAAGHEYDDKVARSVHTTEDLREAMQKDARLFTNYNGDRIDYPNGASPEGLWKTDILAYNLNVEIPTDPAVGKKFHIELGDKNAKVDINLASANNVTDIANAINAKANTYVAASVVGGRLHLEPKQNFKIEVKDDSSIKGIGGDYNIIRVNEANKNDGVEVTVSTKGQFVISNPTGDAYNEDDGDLTDNTGGNNANNTELESNDHDMNIKVTALSDPSQKVAANNAFAKVFAGMNGGLSNGASTNKLSGALTMASFAMTTEVYDSLGSKHTLSVEFRKVSFDEKNGSEWSMLIRIPKPGEINTEKGETFKNILKGTIKFGPDGSIQGYNPTNITYSPNNGAAPGQSIALNFGTLGAYDGMTSYDDPSSSESVSQDGYTGGTLQGITVNDNGVVIGGFTNGKSLSLAQIAVATFTNNSGLESVGANAWIQSPNSGEAVFGTANSGSRGTLKASALEMSNVDLSRSLTQLIVVQRGYQANSKAITTSDEMLNTLLQLK